MIYSWSDWLKGFDEYCQYNNEDRRESGENCCWNQFLFILFACDWAELICYKWRIEVQSVYICCLIHSMWSRLFIFQELQKWCIFGHFFSGSWSINSKRSYGWTWYIFNSCSWWTLGVFVITTRQIFHHMLLSCIAQSGEKRRTFVHLQQLPRNSYLALYNLWSKLLKLLYILRIKHELVCFVDVILSILSFWSFFRISTFAISVMRQCHIHISWKRSVHWWKWRISMMQAIRELKAFRWHNFLVFMAKYSFSIVPNMEIWAVGLF